MSLKKPTDNDSTAILSAAIAAVVYVGVALMFHPQGLDQFIVPKIMVLMVGAPLILAVVLGGRAADPRDPMLVGLTAVFFVWSVAAPLASAQNRTLHGFGAFEAALMAFVFLGALLSRTAGPRGDQRFIRWLAVPTMVIAPLAVMQALGIDPLRSILGLESTRPGRWQVLTTQGNPGWTAELVVLSLPFVLLAWSGDRRWKKIGLISAGAVVVAATVATGSRGGLLGLAVSAVVGLRLGLVSVPKRARLPLGVVTVVVGLGLLAGNFGRLADLEPLTGRLGLWSAGMHLASESPMVGRGLHHVYLVLPEGLEKVVAETEPARHSLLPTLIIDRLDQDLLQVAVERGVPAALLLLAIWARAIKILAGNWRRSGQLLDGAAVNFLIVFGVLSTFSAPFHTPSTSVLFWISIGVAAAGRPREFKRISSVRFRAFAGAGLMIAVALMVTVAAPVFRVNAVAGRAHWERVRNQNEAAVEILEPISGRAPWLPGAAIDRAGALVDLGRASEALTVIEAGEHWAQSERFWAIRARALEQLGLRQEAQRELQRGFKVVPRSPVLLEAQAELGLE